MKKIICSLLLLCLGHHQLDAQTAAFSLYKASQSLPYINAEVKNQKHLYVSAGDRLYCIGDQAGNFPAVGFHVKGEMGGIWQQPIKLLDGYRLEVESGDGFKQKLDKSETFRIYSFTAQHHYQLSGQQVQVSRTQFVPDGLPALVVEYIFFNTGKQVKNYRLGFYADVNLRPVWLGEENGMKDHDDVLYRQNKTANLYSFKDKGNNWFALLSASRKMDLVATEKTPYAGKGTTGKFRLHISLKPGQKESVRFYLSGAYQSYAGAEHLLAQVKKDLPSLFKQKQQRYHRLENTARLQVPDKALQQAWQWGKYSTDWLVRDVPGLGRGLSAGLPDYPWFFSNDQAYTFNALTGFIGPQLFYDSWAMLKKLSDRSNQGNGRIIHEASTNGVVYDQGRMEESQVHIETAWNIFKWTGNLKFLQQNYAYAKKSLTWLMQHDTNHNLYVEGYGGVEIKGLNDEMLDVAVHTQKLFEVMAKMARVLKDKEQVKDYQDKADTLRQRINRDWWIEKEHRYADFLTSREKALEIIDTALASRVDPNRNNWALEKLRHLKQEVQQGRHPGRGYLVYYNTSAILPLKEGIADPDKALKQLRSIPWFTNKFGLYISGIERPDDIAMDEKSVYERNKGEFKYNQAVMPAATASLTIAECRYGSADTALKYIHKTLNSFSYASPGTTYEVAPDYGMFVQAWNITGMYIPVVQYFFGIAPNAYTKEIYIRPDFPQAWKNASLENLKIGDTRLSVSYKKEGTKLTYQITSSAPGWKIHFSAPEKKQLLRNQKNTITYHLVDSK